MQSSLGQWFAIWHPRYRLLLGQLLAAGAVASALSYLDNYVLTALTDSLGTAFDTGASAAGAATPATESGGVFTSLARSLGWSLPLVVLGAFVLARLAAAAVAFWRTTVGGTLQLRARNDLESEILVHLLRKDDTFFSAHSPAETVNRLAVDVFRISERRSSFMTVWWSALLIVGSLVFFLERDWRLALVGLLACAGGALWTFRITRNVSSYDRDFLSEDDRVKAQFEDFLRAAPEIQVADLFARVRARFQRRQVGRSRLFARYTGLRAMLQVANVVSSLLAFAAMIAILLWLSHGGRGQEALVLVPAVIWALPRLFENASELIYLRLDFQLAATSVQRLLEYETAVPLEQSKGAGGKARKRSRRPDATAAELRLENVSYQYTARDGSRQGGVSGVSTVLEPGCWTAIVGGAGSGKSTVLKLLLGRYQPQQGTVRYGQTALGELAPDELAAKLSLMPQTPALLHASIGENVLFGRPGAKRKGTAPDALSADDLELLEDVGLGRVCRLKALDSLPAEPEGYRALERRIETIRRRVRATLRKRCEIEVAAYERGAIDRQQWLLESLLQGRCDRGAVTDRLLGPKLDGRPLLELGSSRLARSLLPLGRQVLSEAQHLLALPGYHLYAELAPVPVDEPIWQLRAASLPSLAGEAIAPLARAALLGVALTSTLVEGAEPERSAQTLSELRDGPTSAELAALGDMLRGLWRPFAADRVHPHVSWRENLVFGVPEVASSRAGRQVEQILLELLEQEDLKEPFTRLGLRCDVGRQGGNLSGGQGQLVALSRALLRRCPVVVLDEPTSALDPASRARVAELLGRWKAGRVVITVSHDPEFVRHADQVRLMESGRLVGSGTFQELLSQSESFRNIMRQS